MTIDPLINQGIDALKKKKLLEAEQIFRTLLKTNPKDPEINHFLGIALQLLNKVKDAAMSYKTAVTLNPNFAEGHKNLGNMLYSLGKIDEAEKSYKKAINLKSNFTEAITVLNIISEQKKVLSKLQYVKNYKERNKQVYETRLSSNPFISTRKVEAELMTCLYKMKSVELGKTKDIRYGNGKCSPDLKLFENNQSVIKTLEKDLIETMKQSVRAQIYVVESFFNILSARSGTRPHRHLDPFDKAYGIAAQKCSLVYYLSTGDQNSTDPGILKLYDPDEEILPTEGSIIIIPAGRKHSSVYNGKIDRVMIGVNFYSLT